MTRILFICAGNVARSQMAEAYYNHLSRSKRASSAGLLDHTPAKYGIPVSEAVEVMLEDGIDIARQRVKTLTPDMVRDADKIYVLCPEEDVPGFVANVPSCHYWDIPDPSDATLEHFRHVRDEIKARIEVLIHPNENS